MHVVVRRDHEQRSADERRDGAREAVERADRSHVDALCACFAAPADETLNGRPHDAHDGEEADHGETHRARRRKRDDEHGGKADEEARHDDDVPARASGRDAAG